MSKQKLSTGERKIQISEVALRIIANEGLKKMTAISIANELGVSDSTIFKHFKNKEEILRAAIDRFEHLLNSCYPNQEEKDPLEKLGKFLINRMEMVKKHPEIIKLVFNERLIEAEGEENKARVKKVVRDSVEFINVCLKEIRDAKKLNILLSPKIIVWMIIGVLHGFSQSNTGTSTNPFSNSISEFNEEIYCAPLDLWQEIKKFLIGKTE